MNEKLEKLLSDDIFMWKQIKERLWLESSQLSREQCDEAAKLTAELLKSFTSPRILDALLEEQAKDCKFYEAGR